LRMRFRYLKSVWYFLPALLLYAVNNPNKKIGMSLGAKAGDVVVMQLLF
jgi:hypothetical protein